MIKLCFGCLVCYLLGCLGLVLWVFVFVVLGCEYGVCLIAR